MGNRITFEASIDTAPFRKSISDAQDKEPSPVSRMKATALMKAR